MLFLNSPPADTIVRFDRGEHFIIFFNIYLQKKKHATMVYTRLFVYNKI